MGKCAGVALWLAAFAVACSGTDSALGPECVEGMTISCTCDDGTPGIKTCGPGSAFGSCECTVSGSLSADQDAPAASASTAGDGQMPGGGTQDGAAGTAAPEPAAGNGDDTGSGDAEPDPSDANSGDGDADTNPNPGSDSDANPTPGGDGDADPGTSGDGDGDTWPPAKPVAKGELYGPCGDAGDCRDDNMCVKGDPLQTEQPAIGYCAPLCDAFGTGGGNGAGNPRPCPQPESGSVAASCNVLSSQCTLASCADAECPAGMSCVERTAARPPGILVTILECAYGG